QDDPFAQAPEKNGKKDKPPVANDSGSPNPIANLPGLGGGSIPGDERIDFEISVKPSEVKRGQIVTLTISGAPRPGFHTYPMTRRTDNPIQDEVALSKLTFEKTPGLQPLWPVIESEPSLVEEQGIGYLLEHEKPFTWSQDILILPDATPGK